MIIQICYTSLVVAGLDATLHFWCDLLGFTVTRQMDESGLHNRSHRRMGKLK